MQSRKYQGYAQSRGFNPISAPDTAARIARQGEQEMRGMERAQRQLQSNQASFINESERVANAEEQNRNVIFNFEREQRKRIYDDEMRNLERRKDVNLGNSVNDLKALSQFSETISKVAIGIAQQKGEADELYYKNLAFEHGITPKLLQEYEQNKAKVDKSAASINNVVNQLEFNGVPVDVLEKFRNLSGRKLYGATTAYAIKGGEDYPLFRAETADTPIPYGDGTITLNTAKTEEEWQAADTFIRMQYLKFFKGINEALLDEHMFPKMRKVETTEKASFQKTLYDNKQADLLEEKTQDLRSAVIGGGGRGLLEYIQREAGYDPATGKGREWLGSKRRESVKILVDLAKKGLITSAHVQSIKDYEYVHNDGSLKKLGEQFKLDLAELDQAVFEFEKRNYEQSEFKEVQAGEELDKMFLEKQRTEGFTDDELEQANQAYRNATNGRESSVLKNIKSSEKMSDEIGAQQLQFYANRNLLTTKELLSGKYSEELITRFKSAAQSGDSLGAVDQESMKKNLQFLYNRANELREDTDTNKRDSSAQVWAQMEIDTIFKRKVLEEVRKGNRDGAVDVATDYVNNLLWDGKKSQKGPFAITGPIKGMNPYAGMGKANPYIQEVKRADEIEKLIYNTKGAAINQQVLLRPDELKQLEGFARGNGTIPSIIFTITARNRNLGAFDVINAQLRAAGMKPLAPVMSEQVRQGLSPMMRRILEYRPSVANTYQAFGMQGGNDPYRPLLDLISSQESSGYGQYDAMNRGGAAGGTIAIGSADSRNIFGTGLTNMTVNQVLELQSQNKVFAAGRYQIIPDTLARLMKGRYGFTGVNANDVFNAATQDKLAIALIKHRAGRFFNGSGTVSDAVVGMGNEWIGLRKVSATVISQRLQNAKVALNSQNYWRQPENMRANVVYRIGSLGYGSTGPHLDVKRVDRGQMNTTGSVPIASSELDSFVDVQVKGKWKPLSRGTTITDHEADHRSRSRSSYGVDFAAPAGTPVRLKNGARVVGSYKGDGGTDHLIIELPDGRRFQFLHGTTG